MPADDRPVVTTLRTRPGALVIGDIGAATWTVRVQVLEAWDAVAVRVAPSASVATLKAAGLAVLLDGTADATEYVVKVHGREVRDETRDLASSGLTDRGTLFLHARRRRPVR